MAEIFDDKRMRHLDYIQGIISRLNSNSFMIKGWAITIVSAVLALMATTNNKSLIAITALPIFVFWVLDSFYLQIERKYTALYQKVIEPDSTIPTLSLNIGMQQIANVPGTKFFDSFFSRTMNGFYISLLVLSLLCTFFITSFDGGMQAPAAGQ